MDHVKKQRLARFSHLLNGMLFLLAGVNLLGDGKMLFGFIQIFASASNLIMLKGFEKKDLHFKLTYLVLFFNIIVAIFTSIDYFQQGTNYIQYMWVLVALLNTVALGLKIKKTHE